MGFESWLEREHVMLLDLDPAVIASLADRYAPLSSDDHTWHAAFGLIASGPIATTAERESAVC